MTINRTNYREYLQAYMDGGLTAEMRHEVEIYMLGNPGMLEEAEEMIFVTPDTSGGFVNKERLYKEPLDDNETLGELLFKIENGDASGDESKEMKEYLFRKPERYREVVLNEMAHFTPDKSIVYPGKKSLKKSVLLHPGRREFISFASAAAILVLVFFLYTPDTKRVGSGDYQPVATLDEAKKAEPALPGENGNQITSSPETIAPAAVSETAAETGSTASIATATYQTKTKEEPVESLTVQPGTPKPMSARLIAATSGVTGAPGLEKSSLTLVLPPLGHTRNIEITSAKDLLLAGVSLLSKIPGDPLTTVKDEQGKSKRIDFNTDMIAFSIPVR